MKSDAQLLELYKEEKALIVGGLNERTGLEEFPSFKEWKLEYMKEYAETHDMDNPVSMEEAVAALEAEIEAGDDELLDEADLAALAADETPETEMESTMTEEVTTPAAEADATPATPEAPAAKPKAKATKKKTAAKKKAPVKKVAAKKKPPSKAGAAQKIFDRLYPKVLDGKKKRKDVIDELVEKAGLTANGAATYYQKMKKAYVA